MTLSFMTWVVGSKTISPWQLKTRCRRRPAEPICWMTVGRDVPGLMLRLNFISYAIGVSNELMAMWGGDKVTSESPLRAALIVDFTWTCSETHGEPGAQALGVEPAIPASSIVTPTLLPLRRKTRNPPPARSGIGLAMTDASFDRTMSPDPP